MARCIATCLLVTTLIFSLTHTSHANPHEPNRASAGGPSHLKNLRTLQSPDCRFLQDVIRQTEVSQKSLPDVLPTPTCPFECCFVVENANAIGTGNNIESESTDFGRWTTVRMNETIQSATPIVVNFANSMRRFATMAAEKGGFTRAASPLRNRRTRAQQISTPIEIGPPINKMPFRDLSKPHETMDAYWQYYGDCDRWEVVFMSYQPASTTINDRVGLEMTLATQIQRFRLLLENFNPVISLISQIADSLDFRELADPFISFWQTAEFRIVESSFSGVFSICPSESIAEDENQHHIR